MGSLQNNLLFTLLITLILFVVHIATRWKTMNKINQEGWKSLIPIYSTYVESRAYSIDKSFPIIYLIVNVMQCISLPLAIYCVVKIAECGSLAIDAISYWLILRGILMISATTLFMHVIFQDKKAKAFGKKMLFTLGLIFVPYVFEAIIAFSDAKYKNPYSI